jgi:hypothetical protein
VKIWLPPPNSRISKVHQRAKGMPIFLSHSSQQLDALYVAS